ncbi:putative reverse transcriptase domain-containing protein [Tanacetum coccineum]
MTQAVIRKLVADSVFAALEAQAAIMANADNTNRNTGPRETPVARKCSLQKSFMEMPTFQISKGTKALLASLLKYEGNVTASKPQNLEEAITITQRLMDQVTTATMITNNNRIEGKKPSRLMLSLQLKTIGILKSFPCVRNASYITQDLALSSVRLTTRWVIRPGTKLVPKGKQQCPWKSILAKGQERSPRSKRSPRKSRTYLDQLQEFSRRGNGHYEFQVMPFGLTNAPAVFMDLMNRNKLYAKFSKCDLLDQYRAISRHRDTSQEFTVDPTKMRAFKNWASPTTPTEVRQLLRLAGYYRRFIEDALSRKERMKPLRVRALVMTLHPKLPSQILEAQTKAIKEENIKAENLRGMDKAFEVRPDGTRCIKNQSWLPLFDLKKLYWWPNMKAIIAEYVGKCLTCSRVKAECQKPSGLLIQPEIPTWKWERITMDFVTKLPKTSSEHDTIWVIVDCFPISTCIIPTRVTDSMETLTRLYIKEKFHGIECRYPSESINNIISHPDSVINAERFAPFEVLYGQKCRSPGTACQVGDVQLTGSEIIHETTEKIVQNLKRLQAARDRKGVYTNVSKILNSKSEIRVI